MAGIASCDRNETIFEILKNRREEEHLEAQLDECKQVTLALARSELLTERITDRVK